MRLSAQVFAAALLLGSCWVTPARPAPLIEVGTVIPANGPRFDGALFGVTGAGQVTFATEKSTRSIPLADLVSWGALVDPGGPIQVLVAGGGLVVADVVRLENESLAIESDLLKRRTIPLEMVAAILFHPPVDLHQRDRLASRAFADSVNGDRLLLANGDELTGRLVALGETAVDFESQGQKISVETPRVSAVGFDPSLAARPKAAGPRTLVGLRDGSRLMVGNIAVDRDEAQLTLADGAVVRAGRGAQVYATPNGQGEVPQRHDRG